MATKSLEIYRCELCKATVEVLEGGAGELVCCNQPMQRMAENTQDAAKEKHVPAIEKIEGGFRVSVGSVLHPMEEKHHIAWIELIADGVVHRKHLEPGDTPVAEFMVEAESVTAREHCNLHGVWKAEA